jgi:hypothetical protein
VKNLISALVLPAMLVVCIAQQTWAAPPLTGGSLSGSVAEYNAAQVRDSHGLLTVPTGMVTYKANTAIPTGTIFNVSLPKGFEYTTEPTLTSTNATMTLVSVDDGGRTARFTVTGEEVSVGDTIVLGGYRVTGALALETITPPGNGLPLYMQALGIDPQPLLFKEFASDSGIVATFAGNNLTVDLGASSSGKKFYGPPDTNTVQLGNVTISAESTDALGIDVMAPDGSPNAISSKDIATLELPGISFSGISVFGSTNSNCSTSTWKGSVTSNLLIFPNLPVNQEVFLCVKAGGTQLIKLMGYPNAETTFGFATGYLLNSHPDDDFVTSGNVAFQAVGNVCYAIAPPADTTCAPEFYNFLVVAKAE